MNRRPQPVRDLIIPAGEPALLTYQFSRLDGTYYQSPDWLFFVDVYEEQALARSQRIALASTTLPNVTGPVWRGIIEPGSYVVGSRRLLRSVRKHVASGYEYTDTVRKLLIV